MPDTNPKIRILIVEDNMVVQQYIKAALAINTDNEILGIVDNGIVAVDTAIKLQPDIILLDLFLPGIDGIDVIHQVMHRAACPIVVISGELDREDRDLTFEAQRAGAVTVLAKPHGMEAKQFDAFSESLCHTVKLMSQVKVTRRWFAHKPQPAVVHADLSASLFNPDFELLVIGSSAGGPAALYKILENLPPNFPYTILITQHIAAGFAVTLCEWLGKTGCTVKIPANGEVMQKGHVYLSPDDKHMVLGKNSTLFLVDNEFARFMPSVDMLYESVAQNYTGKVCAVILTGMGNDGTSGMSKLYHQGVLTMAESESSCIIFGMPKMAIEAGVVKVILPLDEICALLKQAANITHK